MTKYLLSTLLLVNTLWALDVPIDEVERQVFQEQISVNSKIIQLSSSKSLVMAQMGGKIIKYFVKEGSTVTKGQTLALVSFHSSLENSIQISLENSLKIAPLNAELKALRRRLKISNKNYALVKKLYNTGLESRQNLNLQEEEKEKLISKIEVIKVKLSTLKTRKKPSKRSYKIYAQSNGKVDKILVSPNAVVEASTALISIVQGKESFLVQSYVPLKYASDLKLGQKGELLYAGKHYKMHISQILPALDEKTQQILIHSTLDEAVQNLFVNAYVDSKLSIGKAKSYLAIKKSALSFFNNEWVVFIPKHHDEHEGHGHDEHEDDLQHKEESPSSLSSHDEHEGHGHNDHEDEKKHDEHEEEVPYKIRVVKIIKQNDKFVAIEGLKEHEDYVSAKSYYVKSLLLKSSLGGHGH